MKRWHIIAIAAVAVIAALIFGGSLFYKYYIVPKYLSPVIEEISDKIKTEEVLDALYDEAVRFREDDVLDDETYADFMRAYKSFTNADMEAAMQLLDEVDKEENDVSTNSNTLTAKYASSKVGVEMININDGESEGKSSDKYSSERSSDRIKAEDIVAAEKTVAESKGETEGVIDPNASDEENIKSAYAKLKSKMTNEEFSTFLTIMNKLDLKVLKLYMNDKENLKEYLHSKLSDSEYREIVNLGYKYAGVLLNEG